MTGKQKLAQVVKHFDAIRKLYPDSAPGLSLHGIELKDINLRVWEFSGKAKHHDCYKRIPFPGMKKFFDITIFTKEDN